MSGKRITVASAKAKGRRLQNLVAEKISNLLGIPHGKDQLIQAREMGQSGTDVKLIGEALEKFKFSVECKAQENWSVHDWIEQAKRNKIKGTDWLLVAKRSGNEPVVVMDLDTFFRLLKQRPSLKRK